ncbi:MAG: putative beta-lysine N-acetyltransferase [Bacteroidetes bacterium]|nr:putative beta-lysine N-acetyltransferase [Bacteroidota bacterium]
MRTVNTPFDTTEKIRNSVIQHGPSSNRIYLMKLKEEDYPAVVPDLIEMAQRNRYGKIFAKVPAWALEGFLEKGFVKEAEVPGFYNGDTDALFLGMFMTEKRRHVSDAVRKSIADIIGLAESKAGKSAEDTGDTPFTLRRLTTEDAAALTQLYGRVFESYPFPIFERAYIEHTMQEDLIAYYGAFDSSKRLVAASSAEMDKKSMNAEMTDFATHPDHRGHGTALDLLALMEADMKQRGFPVLYTIARAVSAGMNVTFAKAGYHFTGTLVNNTNISGHIESMNVWYKKLTP